MLNAEGAVTCVRCLAGLWVGDLWSSKYVPYSGFEVTVDTGPTGDCRRWRIEVGTLVPGRCLGLGNSSCWETKGYLMKARPYVWLNPKGGMIVRAVCPGLSLCSLQVLLWIVVLSVELEIWSVGLLRHSNSNNNNNNNNVHNTIELNRDATVVKSGKFKDCVLSWKFVRCLQARCAYSWKCFPAIPSDLLLCCCECTFLALRFEGIVGPVAIMIG